MTRDDIHKLIAGYATGTLNETERQALFAAALDDQELFDELAREQELKELLEEPGVRQRLIASLEPARRASFLGKWRKPWPWMAAAATVAAIILGVYLTQPPEPKRLAVFLPPPPIFPAQPPPFVPTPPENSPARELPAPAAADAASALPPPAAAADQVSERQTGATPRDGPQRQTAIAPEPPALKAESAPAPAARAEPGPLAQLPALQSAGGVGGGGGGGGAGRAGAIGGLAQNQFAAKAAVEIFSFSYSVTALCKPLPQRSFRCPPAQNPPPSFFPRSRSRIPF